MLKRIVISIVFFLIFAIPISIFYNKIFGILSGLLIALIVFFLIKDYPKRSDKDEVEKRIEHIKKVVEKRGSREIKHIKAPLKVSSY